MQELHFKEALYDQYGLHKKQTIMKKLNYKWNWRIVIKCDKCQEVDIEVDIIMLQYSEDLLLCNKCANDKQRTN